MEEKKHLFKAACPACGHTHSGTVTLGWNDVDSCSGCKQCPTGGIQGIFDDLIKKTILDRVLYGDGPKEPQGILNTSPLASFALPNIPDMLRDARERPLLPSIPMAIHPDDRRFLSTDPATDSSMLVNVQPGFGRIGERSWKITKIKEKPRFDPILDMMAVADWVPRGSIAIHKPNQFAVIKLDSFDVDKQKEKDMSNIRAILQHQMDSAAERLANLDRFPKEDNYPLGTLIGFDRKFDTGETVYHYAGVKTEKGWFITGREAHRAFTWDGLMLWLAEDGGECTGLVVCSEVTELIEPTEEGEAYATDGEES